MEIRLAFIDVPRLLRDLITRLLEHRTGVEVVEHELDRRDVTGAIAAARVDVLVTSPEWGDPVAIERLLDAVPRLKTLVVLDGGRRLAFYELRPHREIGSLSPGSLVAAIDAARRQWADDLGGAPT